MWHSVKPTECCSRHPSPPIPIVSPIHCNKRTRGNGNNGMDKTTDGRQVIMDGHSTMDTIIPITITVPGHVKQIIKPGTSTKSHLHLGMENVLNRHGDRTAVNSISGSETLIFLQNVMVFCSGEPLQAMPNF